mgnify:CR=1 FL=1
MYQGFIKDNAGSDIFQEFEGQYLEFVETHDLEVKVKQLQLDE